MDGDLSHPYRRRRLPRLTIAALSLLLSLAGAEILLRQRHLLTLPGSDSPYEWDPDKLYRLRPSWHGWYADRLLVTSSRGYRDGEVALAKSPGTTRLLVLGDSVSFGWRVDAGEAYPEVLQGLLGSRRAGAFEVVNTAAPGNTALHQFYDLQRALELEPDAILLQFCPNDVTEPYHVYRRLGGRGYDYHGVEERGWVQRWLEGSSAVYRLAQRLAPLAGLLGESEEEALAAERRREFYSAENLVFRPGDPRILQAWQEYLRWLDAIADLAAAHSLPVVLLATPFEFQVPLPSADARPQRRLEKYASDRGWVYVDWLDALQRLATDGGDVRRAEIDRRLAALPPDELRHVWRRFFLDEDHPSPAGHRFAAKLLLRSLLREPATRPLLRDAQVQRSPRPDGGRTAGERLPALP